MIGKKLKYTNTSSGNQHKPQHLIGNWELPQGEVLAPMAGITDSPFRRLAKRFGAGLVYSECISSEGVRRLGRVSLELSEFKEEERPIAIQLFGSDVNQFAEAAQVIEEKYHPDMIDLNCGCPVKKFVIRCCGGYLMQSPDFIGKAVEAIRQHISTPISVKLRTGYRKPDETAVEAAIAAEEAGASLIAVHGRWVRGAKGTDADWEVIGRVKSVVRKVPVIGNGDIFSFSDARRMVSETGCDRVMIGRWAGGRPWIFEPLASGYPDDDEVEAISPQMKMEVLLIHYDLMLEYFNPRVSVAVHRMRKHIGWYTHGLRGASKLRGEVMTIEDPLKVKDKIRLFKNKLTLSCEGDNPI